MIDNNLLTMTQVMGSIEKMFELMYQQGLCHGGNESELAWFKDVCRKGDTKKIYI